MKFYITYDMYEHDEWLFNIYQITPKMSEVKKDYKKNLLDFLNYGPDACHSYQIQIVDLTEEDYKLLSSQVGKIIDSTDKEVCELMKRIGDECTWCQYDDTNCLLCTDGCTDIDNLDDSLRNQGLDDDEIEQIYYDEDQYKKQLKKYIDETYVL